MKTLSSRRTELVADQDFGTQVESLIEGTLKMEGVTAQLIVSGRGEWRFLDIVSKKAGKLSALQ